MEQSLRGVFTESHREIQDPACSELGCQDVPVKSAPWAQCSRHRGDRREGARRVSVQAEEHKVLPEHSACTRFHMIVGLGFSMQPWLASDSRRSHAWLFLLLFQSLTYLFICVIFVILEQRSLNAYEQLVTEMVPSSSYSRSTQSVGFGVFACLACVIMYLLVTVGRTKGGKRSFLTVWDKMTLKLKVIHLSGLVGQWPQGAACFCAEPVLRL